MVKLVARSRVLARSSCQIVCKFTTRIIIRCLGRWSAIKPREPICLNAEPWTMLGVTMALRLLQQTAFDLQGNFWSSEQGCEDVNELLVTITTRSVVVLWRKPCWNQIKINNTQTLITNVRSVLSHKIETGMTYAKVPSITTNNPIPKRMQ